MTKRIMLAALLATALPARAHILLTTPYQVTGPVGIATAQATDATAVSSLYSAQTNTVSVVFAFGTAQASNGIDASFSASQSAPNVTLTINLTTGSWTASTGDGALASGKLSGAALTSAIATFTGPFAPLRDAADYFAMGNFLPGTQPAVWAAGDL